MPHTKQIKIVFFSILLFYLAAFVFYERWETNIIGGGDSWGYNAYLPALFIHHDLDNLETTYKTRLSYHAGFEAGAKNPLGTDVALQTEDGKQVIKYTVGVAILQAPFFLLGHLTAAVLNYPMDGYSLPYIIFDHLSAIFYAFLGLWFLIVVWRKLFSETTTTLLLVSILLATNLYYFTAYNGVMAHAYLFGLYSLLIYATDRFYGKPNWKMALLVGIAAGMITLIRPVEIFCLAIPVFYGLKNIKERFSFILEHKGLFVIATAAYALMGFFQMIYWKSITGEWIYYSYGDEGFNFKDPQILSGLTSFHNGWLVYTPIMVLALLGILFLLKKRDWFWPVFFFLPIHIYITYSWWCWYYINGFGSRPMVETYALLSIPLGYTIFYGMKYKWSKYLLGLVVFCLAVLNIFQTHQLSKGVMWSETASKAYYLSTFGKTSLNERDLIHYESNETQPDVKKVHKIKDLYFNNYEDSLDQNYQRQFLHEGNFAYKLTKEQTYAPGLAGTLEELGASPGQYMRISAWCYKEIKEPSWWSMSIMVGYFEKNQQVTKFRHTWIGNKLQNRYMSLWGGQAGVWDEIVFFVKVPKGAESTDIFKAFIQNGSGQPVYIDNFKVELWEKR